MVERVKSKFTLGAAFVLCFIIAMFTQAVFLVLKLFGAVTWGWLYVLLPVIIVAAILVLLALFIVVYAAIVVQRESGPADIDTPIE